MNETTDMEVDGGIFVDDATRRRRALAMARLPDPLRIMPPHQFGMRVNEYLMYIASAAPCEIGGDLRPILKSIARDARRQIAGYQYRMDLARLFLSRMERMKQLIPTETEQKLDLMDCTRKYGEAVTEEYLKPYQQHLAKMRKAALWLKDNAPRSAIPDWVEHTINPKAPRA
jgi:hypothetical protein